MNSVPSARRVRACASSFGFCRAAKPAGTCALRSSGPMAIASGTEKRRPLVVINHGTDEMTRLAVSMPVYYWLSRWFVERGYVVVLPQRRGHGATGGPLSELIGTCEHPDHYASGMVAADDIAAAVNYMTQQPFVAPDGAIVVGMSTGGWASLALAARNLPQVQAIVNFAGGRGGHAYGEPNAICGTEELLAAARAYGAHAREPTIWFYAKNDFYFGPKLAKSLAQVWSEAGGSVEEHILPPYGAEGHTIADDRRGWDIWGAEPAKLSDARPGECWKRRQDRSRSSPPTRIVNDRDIDVANACGIVAARSAAITSAERSDRRPVRRAE